MVLVLAAVVGGLFGGAGDAAAADGQAGWVAATDGCSYYSDGSVYAAAACPRTDGGLDFYVAADGEWAYLYSAGYTADGGTWVLLGGTTYYLANATSAQVATLEGMIAAQAGTIGGVALGSGSGPGGLAEGSGWLGSLTSGGSTTASSDFAVCLWSIPSVDWDDDGWTGTGEDADECRSR